MKSAETVWPMVADMSYIAHVFHNSEEMFGFKNLKSRKKVKK